MNESSRSTTLALAALLLAPVFGLSQSPPQSVIVKVNGSSGDARAVQINGKSYVDIESLARITNGSISFHGNQIVLTLPTSSAGGGGATAASSATQPAKPEFSKEFLRAGIEEMSVIREWRIAIVNAVQNNQPVMDEWVSGYRRTAEEKLSLASVALNTDSDRKAFPLLQNEFNNMQKLSDKYLALHKSSSYTSPNSFDNDSLDQQVLSCSKALAAMAASGQFQDDGNCH
jgi:hypothetical protein